MDRLSLPEPPTLTHTHTQTDKLTHPRTHPLPVCVSNRPDSEATCGGLPPTATL